MTGSVADRRAAGRRGLRAAAGRRDPPALAEADREHRPDRLARLRERLAAEGVDAYFGVRPEHMRWLTGFTLAEGEDKVAGHSGQFLVGADEVLLLTDSRYTVQAKREAPDCTIEEIGLRPARTHGPRLLASLGARRVAVEATAVPHALWTALETAAPDVELVPAGTLAGGDAGGQDQRRGGAHRRRVRRRGPGARDAAPGDPSGRHGSTTWPCAWSG